MTERQHQSPTREVISSASESEAVCEHQHTAGSNTAEEKLDVTEQLPSLTQQFFAILDTQGTTTDHWCCCGACLCVCFLKIKLETHAHKKINKNGRLEAKLSHFFAISRIPVVVIYSESVSGVGTGRGAFRHGIVWLLPAGFV